MHYIPNYKIALIRDGSIKTTHHPKIYSSEDIYQTFKEYFAKADRELCAVCCLNGRNKILAFNLVHMGSVSESIASTSQILKPAILINATSIIMMHNHPSGDPMPSREDNAITKKLKIAGQHLDIQLLDHIIFGDDSYFSMADQGMLAFDAE